MMADEKQQNEAPTYDHCLFVNMFEISACLNIIDADFATEMKQNADIRETMADVRLQSKKEKHQWMDHLLNTAAQDLMKMNVAKALLKVGQVRSVLDEPEDTMANKMQYYILCLAFLQRNRLSVAWTMGAICQGTKDLSLKAKEMDVEINRNFKLIEVIFALPPSKRKWSEQILNNMWKQQKKDRLQKEAQLYLYEKTKMYL